MRSSLFWFVFTPIAAKLLLALKFDVLVNTPYAAWAGILVLPFPWWLLYVASLFFALGRLAFRFKCHPIVRDYANYAEFRDSGVASFQLTEWYNELMDTTRYGSREDELISNGQALALDGYCERCFGRKLTQIVEKETLEKGELGMIALEVWEQNIPERRVGDAFHMVRDEADRINPHWALFAVTFFALGLLSSAILIVQNLVYVWRAI